MHPLGTGVEDPPMLYAAPAKLGCFISETAASLRWLPFLIPSVSPTRANTRPCGIGQFSVPVGDPRNFIIPHYPDFGEACLSQLCDKLRHQPTTYPVATCDIATTATGWSVARLRQVATDMRVVPPCLPPFTCTATPSPPTAHAPAAPLRLRRTGPPWGWRGSRSTGPARPPSDLTGKQHS